MMRTATAIAVLGLATAAHAAGGPTVNVTYPASLAAGPLDGRLLLLLSTDDKEEPRLQISDTELGTQQVFGIDVDGWKPGAVATFDAERARLSARAPRAGAAGHLQRAGAAPPLRDVPPRRRPHGEAADGPRRGAAVEPRARQPLQHAAEDRRSTRERQGPITIALDKAIPRSSRPPDTKYVKHERIQSERLSKFWGRDMYLGAHVLLPRGLRHAPGRALSARHQPRPLPRELRRLPRGAARPGPEVRALASASSSTATTARCRSTRTSSTRTGRARTSRAC